MNEFNEGLLVGFGLASSVLTFIIGMILMAMR
jgi:hypothetical protein